MKFLKSKAIRSNFTINIIFDNKKVFNINNTIAITIITIKKPKLIDTNIRNNDKRCNSNNTIN